MRKFTQEFIEDHIDLIENKEYAKICREWYESAECDPLDYDDAVFDEFVTILKHALNIDFIKDASKERHGELYFQLDNIINQYLSKNLYNTFRKKINKRMFTDNLSTTFNFTDAELFAICDEVARDLGLTVERHTIVVEGLHI